MDKVKVQLLCDIEEHGGNKKLVPKSHYWDEWNGTPFCVHGIKLRWSCDYCEGYFYNEGDAES